MLLHKNVPIRNAFAQECSYLQGIFIYINERDTSPDCTYKHKLGNRASPDKFSILYRVIHIECHGFTSSIGVLGLSHFSS